MNPASSSSSSNTGLPRRVSVHHRGATSDTATSSAADAAILQLVESRRRRKSGQEPPRHSRSRRLPAASSARQAFRWPRIPRAAAVIVAGIVGLLVVGTAVARVAGGRADDVQPLQGRLVVETVIPAWRSR